MSIWLLELFSPDALVSNVALLLIVVALAMPNIPLVRLVALAGGIVGIVVSSAIAFDRAGLFWWSLLTVVVVIRLLMHDPRGLFGRLSAEEAEFHRAVLPRLSRTQVRLLLHHGRWHDVPAGHVFTREGEAVRELVYVARGEVETRVAGKHVGLVTAGSLIGEIGVSTGDPATATTVAATDLRCLTFESQELYRFLDDHVAIQDAVELAVERNMRDKLAEANRAAAGQTAGS